MLSFTRLGAVIGEVGALLSSMLQRSIIGYVQDKHRIVIFIGSPRRPEYERILSALACAWPRSSSMVGGGPFTDHGAFELGVY
jgi:hypothetical protein